MPALSIIVPCYNEQSTIRLLLEAIAAQTYPCEDLEVIVADGLSEDGTQAEIARFQADRPDLSVSVVDNPRRIIPAGLNCALATARGRYILRLDAHCIPAPDYLARSLADLQQGLGAVVGGVWEIRPGGSGWPARAIAAAAAHPLGVGDALYRHATQAGPVDTVPFGAYERELVNRIGRYDERLLTNEDYEFNTRVRLNGGIVWLDPAIHSVYFARSSLGSLSRQYWRYGYWKRQMLRRYARTLRWRQALPPLFVASLILLAVLGLLFHLAWYLLVGELALYLLVLGIAGLMESYRHQDPPMAIGLPLSIATMHLSWGAGFIWSLIHNPIS